MWAARSSCFTKRRAFTSGFVVTKSVASYPLQNSTVVGREDAFTYMCVYIAVEVEVTDSQSYTYGVATSSRLLQTIGLFCRISSPL